MELYVWGREGRGEAGEKDRQGGRGEKMDVLSFNPFLLRGEAEAEERGEDVGWAFEEEKSERTRTFAPFFFCAGNRIHQKSVFLIRKYSLICEQHLREFVKMICNLKKSCSNPNLPFKVPKKGEIRERQDEGEREKERKKERETKRWKVDTTLAPSTSERSPRPDFQNI